MFTFSRKSEMPAADDALPGRSAPIPTAREHFINGHSLKGPYPEGLAPAMFGLGCFWGAERKFWELGDGVYATAVGYAGGYTPNPRMRKCAAAVPATTRSCWSSTIRRRSPTSVC